MKLDLRDSDVRERPSRITLACIFSDVDIYVPKDWNVNIETLPLLAETIDKRLTDKVEHEEIDLVLDGWAIICDIYLRD